MSTFHNSPWGLYLLPDINRPSHVCLSYHVINMGRSWAYINDGGRMSKPKGSPGNKMEKNGIGSIEKGESLLSQIKTVFNNSEFTRCDRCTDPEYTSRMTEFQVQDGEDENGNPQFRSEWLCDCCIEQENIHFNEEREFVDDEPENLDYKESRNGNHQGEAREVLEENQQGD